MEARTGDQMRFTAALIIVQSWTLPLVLKPACGEEEGTREAADEEAAKRGQVHLAISELEPELGCRGR